MDQENLITKAVTGVVLFLILSITSCQIHADNKIASMTEAGIAAQAAACAIKASEKNCLIANRD